MIRFQKTSQDTVYNLLNYFKVSLEKLIPNSQQWSESGHWSCSWVIDKVTNGNVSLSILYHFHLCNIIIYITQIEIWILNYSILTNIVQLVSEMRSPLITISRSDFQHVSLPIVLLKYLTDGHFTVNTAGFKHKGNNCIVSAW